MIKKVQQRKQYRKERKSNMLSQYKVEVFVINSQIYEAGKA